jgi:hypothetical protein
MPRFTDAWVMDRVLFDYMSGGSCACCGIPYSSLLVFGSDTSDLIRAASDLDDVAVRTETNALDAWPQDLRETVWSDRIRLRQKLKISRKAFQTKLAPLLLLLPSSKAAAAGGDGGSDTASADSSIQRGVVPQQPQGLEFPLRLSKQDFLQHLQDRYKVHSAFIAVLECVLEQIANFALTQYDFDGVEEDERAFEANLTLKNMMFFELSDENVFRNRCAGMMKGKLLPQKKLANDWLLDGDDDEYDEDDDEPRRGIKKVPTPSFASDRRLIRLVLARYWAEAWIEKRADALASTIPKHDDTSSDAATGANHPPPSEGS